MSTASLTQAERMARRKAKMLEREKQLNAGNPNTKPKDSAPSETTPSEQPQ